MVNKTVTYCLCLYARSQSERSVCKYILSITESREIIRTFLRRREEYIKELLINHKCTLYIMQSKACSEATLICS